VGEFSFRSRLVWFRRNNLRRLGYGAGPPEQQDYVMDPIMLGEFIFRGTMSWLLTNALTKGSRLIRRERSTKFLEYDPKVLNDCYIDEKRLGDYLPYKEGVNWIDAIIAGRSPEISIFVEPGKFQIGKGNREWQVVQSEAFGAYLADGHARKNDPVVRLNRLDVQDGTTALLLQEAEYHDQGRSNMVLDYKSQRGVTLRSLLVAEYSRQLPPLSEARLGNTIGMATLILYPDKDGCPVPYLVRRAKNLSVYHGGAHASASCAAEWIPGARRDFASMLLNDMHSEIEQELGVSRDETSPLYPVALCREFLRAGKPQFFFLAATRLNRKELKKKRQEAMERNKKAQPEKVELLPDRLWRQTDVTKNATSRILPDNSLTLEATALLFYWAKIISKASRRASAGTG
jgi:hypothetical protein